ncbi:MAG: hypothetical protein MJ074_06575 [Oscillospiraceae bacterium]|nr:hypothetical protein [Oscillospiraceae bacterium]
MKRALVEAIFKIIGGIINVAFVIAVFCLACYMAGVFFAKGALHAVKYDRAAAVIIGERSER